MRLALTIPFTKPSIGGIMMKLETLYYGDYYDHEDEISINKSIYSKA